MVAAHDACRRVRKNTAAPSEFRSWFDLGAGRLMDPYIGAGIQNVLVVVAAALSVQGGAAVLKRRPVVLSTRLV